MSAAGAVSAAGPGSAAWWLRCGRRRCWSPRCRADLEQAIALAEQSVAESSAGDPQHAASLSNLGTMLSEVGRPAEALHATEQAVEIRRRPAENDPTAYEPDLASARNNLASAYATAGHLDQAIQLYELTLHGSVRVLGEHHPFSRPLRAVACDVNRSRFICRSGVPTGLENGQHLSLFLKGAWRAMTASSALRSACGE